MQSHELLREVFKKTGAKQVAADLDLSLSMIYKWAETPNAEAGSGAVNPLDRLAALYRSTQDRRLVQWICQEAGGFFVRNPNTTQTLPSLLMPATHQIIQEFADLLGVVVVASEDNAITKKEAQAIRARWEELKSVTEEFVRCSEQGNFSPLHAKHAPPPPVPHPRDLDGRDRR